MARYDPPRSVSVQARGHVQQQCLLDDGWSCGTDKSLHAQKADSFTISCEKFRQDLNHDLAERRSPVQFSGLGSLITIHFARGPINTPRDIPPVSKKLGQLFHMESLLRSVLITARGDIFISLPVTAAQLQTLRDAVLNFVEDYSVLIERELSEHT